MVYLPSLAVPILLAAVLVFLASAILHMLLSAWHQGDLSKVPEEDRVMDALRPFNLQPGNYAMPLAYGMPAMKDPAFIEKMTKGPVVFFTVRRSGPPSMGRELALWFVYNVIVSVFAAYVASRALGAGANYLEVFRFAGTTAFAAYGLGLMQESIWWGRNWTATIKSMIDGLIYAGITGGTLGWLWPA
jgi:hypothetical protein